MAGLSLAFERTLPAAREQVFAAFTDAMQVARWWGPVGFTVPSIDFDPRRGATYRIDMQPPDAEAFYLRGEFREVEAPERLAFTFAWEPPDPDDVENLVELSFADADGSTEVAFRQGPFKTEARVELHRNGWNDTFDRLEQILRQDAASSDR